jgi:hypothetical protein
VSWLELGPRRPPVAEGLEHLRPVPKGPDGYLIAAGLMFLLAPVALPVWALAAHVRRRVEWWVLPAGAVVLGVVAVLVRSTLAGVYHDLGVGLVQGVQEYGLRPSWGLLGAAGGVFGRSLILTAPVGIPVGLAAGQLTARAQPPAPIPMAVPEPSRRPPPERVERSPFLAVAVKSTPPGDLPPEWRHGQYVAIPPREAGLSRIAVGRPGSGKSKLIARETYLAGRDGTRAILADCKGEESFPREVVSAYLEGWRDGGQPGQPDVHVWPAQPLSAWTGGPVAVANRLLACWAWNPRNEWHREPVAMALRLALQAPAPEITCSADLLARLRPGVLERLWEDHEDGSALVRSLGKDHRLDDVGLRIGNLMASLGQLLDGDPTRPLGTADLTVISLPVMAAEHDASAILRVLLADLAHHVVARKPPGERELVVIDEASAIPAGRDHMTHIAERGRSAGVACLMCVQSDQGLGSDTDINRLLGAVGTVVLFSTAEPERLIRLAGSRRQVEDTSTTTGDDGITRYTSAMVWKDQVDPNVVRALPVGHAFVMSGGRAQLVRIILPPEPAPTGLTEPCAAAPARALASREIPGPAQPPQDLATRPAAPASDLDPSGPGQVRRYRPPRLGGEAAPPDDRDGGA